MTEITDLNEIDYEATVLPAEVDSTAILRYWLSGMDAAVS